MDNDILRSTTTTHQLLSFPTSRVLFSNGLGRFLDPASARIVLK